MTATQTRCRDPRPSAALAKGGRVPPLGLPLHQRNGGNIMIESLLLSIVLTTINTEKSSISTAVQGRVVAEAAKIPGEINEYAMCVSNRESHHNYKVRNPTSSAQGRWQFLDNKWRINGGIQYVVSRRLDQFGLAKPTIRAIREHLAATEIAKWEPHFQDIAFNQVIAEGGSNHWHIAGSRCNALDPKVGR
jgi:hypothetical protein